MTPLRRRCARGSSPAASAPTPCGAWPWRSTAPTPDRPDPPSTPSARHRPAEGTLPPCRPPPSSPPAAPGRSPPAATTPCRARAPRPGPSSSALLVLAAVLDLWALSRNGLANEYYSAAVRSMSGELARLPLRLLRRRRRDDRRQAAAGLWVQALSARAFGFTAWSLLVPQALMGVATVGLAYDLTRRRFGRAAGLRGGPRARADADHRRDLAPQQPRCAARPLLHRRAVGRSSAGSRTAARAGSSWPGVCVGLGFEAKMAAALLVVPGLAAAWLWVASARAASRPPASSRPPAPPSSPSGWPGPCSCG